MELVLVSLDRIASQWLWLIGLLAGAGLLLVVERLFAARLCTWGRRSLHGAAIAFALVGGLWLAWQTLWLCDDAYISFRYAKNFAQGHGLVFNPGGGLRRPPVVPDGGGRARRPG